jgi:hypothetical protein
LQPANETTVPFSPSSSTFVAFNWAPLLVVPFIFLLRTIFFTRVSCCVLRQHSFHTLSTLYHQSQDDTKKQPRHASRRATAKPKESLGRRCKRELNRESKGEKKGVGPAIQRAKGPDSRFLPPSAVRESIYSNPRASPFIVITQRAREREGEGERIAGEKTDRGVLCSLFRLP